MDGFSLGDTATIRRLVRSRPSQLQLCALTEAGNCAPDADVWMVISEVHDLTTNGLTVYIMVVDQRRRADAQQFYAVRLGSILGRWRVLSFDRVD